MMEIFWTMLASQDRKRIREYIAEQNLIAAIELDERIACSASLLFSLSFISVQVHDNIITV
ncbi:TPA: type II toxin-antitoxin system RelE/ParE family toxin [Escherichia coli]|nr:addiction module toxin RelE [Escherichia coli]HBA7879725.1 type II toxin-antitoxin system RelE/ParE family toxin [Escherichia coli]HCR5264322.1 type II toxin-antitoxin system RelE/ParE family toxin [Escherichia coli]